MKSSDKWNWRKKSLLLLTLTATAGCVHGSTTPPPLVTNSYCKIAQPIRYNSKLDSPATAARIEQHNSTWACLCGSPPDCPIEAGRPPT